MLNWLAFSYLTRGDTHYKYIDKIICNGYINKITEFWKVVQTTFFSEKEITFLDKTKVATQEIEKFGIKVKTFR